MSDEVEEVAVVVIAGSWNYSESGAWDFDLAKECYARNISMSSGMSYEDLVSRVSTEFELQEMPMTPKLSYWLPCQLSIFSINNRPPVIVTTTMGVRNFFNVRRGAINLNLLLSLEASQEEVVGMRSLRQVTNASHGGDNDGPNYRTPEYVQRPNECIRMFSVNSLGLQSNEGSSGAGVRRRLFNDSIDKGKGIQLDDGRLSSGGRDSSRVDGCVREFGEGSSVLERVVAVPTEEEQWPGTDIGGIIALADGATPSLSNHIDEHTEEDYNCNSEDERVLHEIQLLEEQQEQLERATAKEVVPHSTDQIVPQSPVQVLADSENYIVPDECIVNDGVSGQCFTDGLTASDDEAAEQFDSPFWNHVVNTPVVEEIGQSFMEEGGPSSVAQPQDGMMQGAEQDRADVGAEVLTYVRTATQTATHQPISRNTLDDDINFEQTLPTEDAEPVFDDAIDLTNIDGCGPVSAEEDAIYIGRVFKDKDDMQNTVSIYAIKRLFYFRQTRSDPERLIFVCVDPHCRWRVFGHSVSKFSKNFEVRTATLTHTCTITSRAQYSKLASSKVIASVLNGKYAGGRPGPRASDIPHLLLGELKVSVTYMKAWYGKEIAVRKSRGSDEESYKLLATYMYLLEQGNPGTVYKLEHTYSEDGSKKFKYLFFSLAASIAGIKHCRKVILVDGTTIKAKFKGCLIAASMQDANFQVYPIAFAVVDSENEAAWTWFFRQLSFIVPDAEDLVIVSDRHRAIYAGIGQVYQKAFHGACAVHIERNVRHFAGKGLSALVGKAARAFNVGAFNETSLEIANRSRRCAEYLNAIPLGHWTQAHCPAKRYNIMSSNVAEALNSAIAKIVELPIVTMVESIRTKLMQWFCLRRAKAQKLSTLPEPITPNVNKFMLRNHVASAGLAVIAVSDWAYQVSETEGKTYFVDLEKKSCTCNGFQKLLIPCCHALAAARINGVYIPSLVGEMYRVTVFGATYEALIYPVPNQGDGEVPVAVVETEFNPPTNPPGPGRRRKRRIPSTGEHPGNKRKRNGPHKCSTCGQVGHNRATCKNIVG